jgi:glycosyltransferase involved in cell wall biosynthesis
MRILQVIPYMTPRRGGDVKICATMARQLAGNGHEITIVTTDFELDMDYVQRLTQEKITVLAFHCSLRLGLFLFTPDLGCWLRENLMGFDIVHLHSFRSYQNAVVRRYSKRYGVPYVLQAHGSVLPFFAKRLLKRMFDVIWGFALLRDANRVVAVSEKEKGQYKKMGVKETRIAVVLNAIEPMKTSQTLGKESFRKKFGIKDDDRIVLYMGRLHKRKGLSFLVRAFKEISSQRKDLYLVIAGQDDGYERKLKRLVAGLGMTERTKIIGYYEDASILYDEAAILVYPSIHEIFGLVPFEALMQGVPVIVSNDSGCGDLVRKWRCGLLVNFGDYLDLRDKILLLLENPDLGVEIVDRGRRFISENLTWAANVKTVEGIYADCIRDL